MTTRDTRPGSTGGADVPGPLYGGPDDDWTPEQLAAMDRHELDRLGARYDGVEILHVDRGPEPGSRMEKRALRQVGGLFAFAGLWESWGRGDERLDSCTILTTRPNDLVRPVHDRMPAILPVEASGAWLDPAATREDLAPLLEPLPADRMSAMQVSQRVNRATVDDPGCVESAESTLF